MEIKDKPTTDSEVKIVHVFDAPRELVFSAWTDPDLLLKWYAPIGCTIRFKNIEVRKGGSFHSCIENPEFGSCWCKGIYHEVIFPERIVYSMIIADEEGNELEPIEAGMDPAWPKETTVTVVFTELKRKTTLTLTQTVSQSLAKKTGAHPSWIQMLERLDKELHLLNN